MKTSIIVLCALFGAGVALSLIAMVLTSYSLTLRYWIDYSTVTTFATGSGFTAATGTVTTTANFGLYKSCYTAVTVVTVTFTSTTTTTTLSDCLDSDSTTYIDGDIIKSVRGMALSAATIMGLAMIAGIVSIVMVVIPRAIPNPAKISVPFISFGLAFAGCIMMMVALIYLDNKIITGMTIGDSANYAIAACALVGVASFLYLGGGIFLIIDVKKAGRVGADGKKGEEARKEQPMVTIQAASNSNLKG